MSKTLVLGLGNLLLSDEGFGVQALARLRDRFVFPEDVELVDGGTLGLHLLPTLEDADRILVLDAVDAREPPGTVVRLGWDDLPRVLRLKISPHQVSALDAFALLELRRGRPQAFEVIGVQPRSLEWGIGLTPEVEAAVESGARETVEILTCWGHRVMSRDGTENEERERLSGFHARGEVHEGGEGF